MKDSLMLDDPLLPFRMTIATKTTHRLILILLSYLPFHALVVTVFNKILFNAQTAPHWSLSIIPYLLLFLIAGSILWSFRKLSFKQFSFDKLDYLLASFFLLAFIMSIFTGRNLKEIGLGIKYNLVFLGFFWLLKPVIFNKKQLQSIIKTMLVSSQIILGFGIISYLFFSPEIWVSLGYYDVVSTFTGQNPIPYCHLISGTETCRLQSSFSSPNHLAGYLLIIIPFLFTKYPPTKKFFWPTLTIICLILTFSRGAILGLIIASLVSLYLIIKNKKIFWGSIISLLIISVSLSYLFQDSSFIQNLILRTASSTEHFHKSIESLNLMIQYPLGLGLGRAGPASGYMTDSYFGLIPENWFIQIGLEMGFLGLLIFLAIIIYLLKYFYQQFHSHTSSFYHRINFSLLCSFGALNIMNLFLHTWESSVVALTMWGLLGIFYKIKAE